MDLDTVPTYVWYVLPIAIVCVVVVLIYYGRQRFLQARGIVRALRSGPSDTVVAAEAEPPTGEQALRLALGAMMAVGRGEPWNTLRLSTSLRGVTAETIGNPGSWGISDTDDLRAAAGRMLDEEFGDGDVQVVLDLRAQLIAQTQAPVTGEAWLAALDQAHTAVGAPQSLHAERRAAAQRVIAYETRMAADDILPGPVQSPLAYDYGRAVNLARWGVVCGYIGEPEAEQIVRRAGELAFARYRSWPEYAAAYLLGRVIAFDADQGEWYTDTLDTLRVLQADPASPSRLNPWPGRPSA